MAWVLWKAGKDLNHGYLNYVEPDTASSTSEITEMLDETPGLERVRASSHSINRNPSAFSLFPCVLQSCFLK